MNRDLTKEKMPMKTAIFKNSKYYSRGNNTVNKTVSKNDFFTSNIFNIKYASFRIN